MGTYECVDPGTEVHAVCSTQELANQTVFASAAVKNEEDLETAIKKATRRAMEGMLGECLPSAHWSKAIQTPYQCLYKHASQLAWYLS
jgi:hypothetical protein